MSRLDKAAFERLIEPHFDRLFRFAYRLSGTRSDAEDLVQDVLIKLFERGDELSSIQDLAPWLGRVLYNQFIDGKRRYGRQPLTLVAQVPETPTDDAGPFEAATRQQQAGQLRAALDKLSEEHRVMVLMHDAEGYTLPEIETLTGIPLGTCKSRLNRARARLRELLHCSEPGNGTQPHDQPKKKNMEPFSSAERVGG